MYLLSLAVIAGILRHIPNDCFLGKQNAYCFLQEIMSNDPNSTNKDAFAAKKKKRMSVERIYQKKTQLEHILLRPDTYIGSVEPIKQNMWVYDAEMAAIVSKEITFVPGLYKIFDEILGKHTLLKYMY